MKTVVIGAGSWGTAMAGLLAENGHKVTLWARSSKLVAEMESIRQNTSYLPGVTLPLSLSFTDNLAQAVSNCELIVLATPSHVIRQMAASLKGLVSKDTVILSAAKGLELGTLKRMSEVIAEELPLLADKVAVISGPNHAEEVGSHHPTTTVVSSLDPVVAQIVQDAFMSPYFRVYTNPDLIGVELGGALKNIIALGAGIAEGLDFGDNSKAALMTRGLAEIARLGIAMNAKALTFAGLSGIGDLMVTCTSKHSRNRRAGILLAQGKTVTDIQAGTNMVVEGIKSTLAAYELSRQHGIEMPITNEIYQVLYQGKSPRDAVLDLMTRSKTREVEEVALASDVWCQ